MMPTQVFTCRSCGLAQTIPDVPVGMRAACARCDATIRDKCCGHRSNNRTAAIAVAALILYPLAIWLPMLKVQQLGHQTESSILQGISGLFSKGQFLIGMIVLLCSVIFPLCKLSALLALTSGGLDWLAHRHRALAFRLIEWTGRWGMMDVLLVAILVAALKLGDWMQVTPGPGTLAFTICVVLSLLATASFDPHSVWDERH